MQVFLDFANFYRRFIRDYFIIAAPLISLLKGSKIDKKLESFKWPEDARLAFEQLRSIFATTSFLRHYDSSKKLRLETDISNFGVKVILSQ